MTRTKVGFTLVVAGALALLALGSPALVSPALAKTGDVLVRGSCSARSAVKLKLSDEDGRIEAEVEVDQNRNGVQWTWTLLRGQRQLATGKATTRRPSGSFEVRRLVNDNNGTDTLTAKATRASGERCTVTARI
jgi:hypothetical protein